MANQETLQANFVALGANPYPGRGIVMGLNKPGDEAQQVYWLMGRSEPSRARLLVEEDDIIKTAPHNLPEEVDTSLIIYNAMTCVGDIHVVSNGDQTDTIVTFLKDNDTFEDALETREYEPDIPNYTPRISGYFDAETLAYGLSVIRKIPVSDLAIRGYFGNGHDNEPLEPGIGRCIHTYKDDGEPLPSFDGVPYPVPLGENVNETAELYWGNLNHENKVALVVKGIKLANGEVSYRIINTHEQ